MIGRLTAFIGAGVFGSGIGIASALALTGLLPGLNPLDFGNIEVAGWRSDFSIGSRAADPYTRARVARHGLLALAQSEAVYFTRSRDDAGDLFSEACHYRLSGGAMPAGWWSVTLYDAASMLPTNDDEAPSIDASRVGAGRWEAIIAPHRPDGAQHWISSQQGGPFDLTLRLYMPQPELLVAPEETLAPPKIEKLGCEDAA